MSLELHCDLFSAAGIPAGLYGKLVGASDYQLNLHPPEEDTQDVLDSLDSVMAVRMRCIRVGVLGRGRVRAPDA